MPIKRSIAVADPLNDCSNLLIAYKRWLQGRRTSRLASSRPLTGPLPFPHQLPAIALTRDGQSLQVCAPSERRKLSCGPFATAPVSPAPPRPELNPGL